MRSFIAPGEPPSNNGISVHRLIILPPVLLIPLFARAIPAAPIPGDGTFPYYPTPPAVPTIPVAPAPPVPAPPAPAPPATPPPTAPPADIQPGDQLPPKTTCNAQPVAQGSANGLLGGLLGALAANDLDCTLNNSPIVPIENSEILPINLLKRETGSDVVV